MNIKLTKQQEKVLIEMGLRMLFRQQTTTNNVPVKTVRKSNKKRRWTKAQRDKFRTTMLEKYGRMPKPK